ncbi:MAG: hypothetical protein ACRCZA_06185 [Shewanella sp.]|uniref:hypothetical protein n=1 Tax=Shewanella sp. TaxID=50422 RepID=UPI003F2BBCE2
MHQSINRKHKIYIYSPSYNENIGGIIALHKLCHTINSIGGDSVLVPTFPQCRSNPIKRMLKWIKWFFLNSFKYKTNKLFNTPVEHCISKKAKEYSIALYPEIINGNPLKAKHVVRWFLHNPGYHTGNVEYGKNEIYFSYGSFGLNYVPKQGSILSKNKLEVTHLFFDLYNKRNLPEKKEQIAYCIRKGKGKKIVHDVENSILIDGLSHSEVASVLKKSKYFISYDAYTAYTWFAILCGCIPIIIPDDGVTKEEWHPDESLRCGIAYGYDGVALAISQQEEAIAFIKNKEELTKKSVKVFIDDINKFFG